MRSPIIKKEYIEKISLLLCILTLPFVEAGCQANVSSKERKEHSRFVLPEIPSDLQTMESRLDYMTRHYWDHFDFKDTAYIHLPDITEQAIVDYIDLLCDLPRTQREDCVVGMLGKASVEPLMLRYIVSVLHEYWAIPQSPFYEATFYEPVARYILSSQHFYEADKSRAAFELRMSQINNVGTMANDFKYILPSGMEQQMSKISSPYLLLLFYDPDCHNCQDLLSQIKSSERLQELIADKKVKVLAMYPLDDVAAWKQYKDNIPATWLNGYDKDLSIQNGLLYNLVNMPSIYILDSQKRVLQKDVDIRGLTDFLDRL